MAFLIASESKWRFCNYRRTAVSEAQRALCNRFRSGAIKKIMVKYNGQSPTDTPARSGITVVAVG
jgi:hypothetical protein